MMKTSIGGKNATHAAGSTTASIETVNGRRARISSMWDPSAQVADIGMMWSSVDNAKMPSIDALIADFFIEIGHQPVTVQRYPIATFQSRCDWPDWAPHPGVYFFERDNLVSYVGRALRVSLRERVKNQCNSFGDPLWDAVISDGATTLGVVAFPKERWY